jgi:hypothetical protein
VNHDWHPNRVENRRRLLIENGLLRVGPPSTSSGDQGTDAPTPEAPAVVPIKTGAAEALDRRTEAAEPKPSATDSKPMIEPKPEAFLAYAKHVDAGWDQATVARKLSEELGRPINQGQVSRWVKQVREWREAGNPFPEGIYTPKTIPTDPSKLDKGPRQ